MTRHDQYSEKADNGSGGGEYIPNDQVMRVVAIAQCHIFNQNPNAYRYMMPDDV
jgi:hypothetical protein